jgi:hypothetical protein
VIAWAVSRTARAKRVESAWLISAVSFGLFVLGVVLCWFGVSAVMGI